MTLRAALLLFVFFGSACGFSSGSREAETTGTRLTHLVESGGDASWTPRGLIVALAYVEGVGPERHGHVVCDLARFDPSTGLAVRGWGRLRGELRDARPHQGPSALPTLAVPLELLEPAVLTEGVHARAECRFSAGGVERSSSLDMVLQPAETPNLRLRDGVWLDAFECETNAAPSSEHLVCLRVLHEQPTGLRNSWNHDLLVGTTCEFYQDGDPSTTNTSTTATALEELTQTTLRVRLPAGHHRVRCHTDAANHIAESDEEDNFAETTLDIAPSRDDSLYGLRIVDVAADVAWLRADEESGGGISATLVLHLDNTSPYPVRGAEVVCEGDGIRFEGGFSMSPTSFPEHAIAPGNFSVRLHPTSTVVTGSYELRCNARLTSPVLPHAPAANATITLRVPPSNEI